MKKTCDLNYTNGRVVTTNKKMNCYGNPFNSGNRLPKAKLDSREMQFQPFPPPPKKVLQWRKLLQKLGTKTIEAAFVQILTCWLVPWVISNKTLATCKKQFPLVNFSTVWLHYSFVLGCFSALRTPVTILKLFKFGEKKIIAEKPILLIIEN